MTRALKLLILIVLTLAVVLFALANRAPVVVAFDPFTPDNPLWSLSAPLWIVMMSVFAAGVAVGGIAAWLVQAKHRRAERAYKREARDLRREVDRVKEREAQTGIPALSAPTAVR